MNTVAIVPQLFMRFLQTHNVKRNIISNKVVDQTNSQPMKKEENISSNEDVVSSSIHIPPNIEPQPQPPTIENIINISSSSSSVSISDGSTLISELPNKL
jgi:hypothetical protein